MVSVPAGAAAEAGGLVPLAAAVEIRAAPAMVMALLSADPPGWLRLDDVDGRRRFAIDLRLRVGGDHGGLTTFRKAAYVDLGDVSETAGGAVVPVGWRASTAAPLFPVFSGSLELSGRTLRTSGLYAPPGGVLGRIADRALLHVAATGTARWLLAEIDRLATAWADTASTRPQRSGR